MTSLYDYCAAQGQQDLLNQWDGERNGELTPETVPAGSHKRVWWRCAQGHRWQTAIRVRTRGCGCPVCTNRVAEEGFNDLSVTHPELSAQWHPSRNGDLTPADVSMGSERKVWWRCEKGHEWQAHVYARAGRRDGCPVCAGKVVVAGENDLASKFPDLAAQWHPILNGTLVPDQVSVYSNRTVTWLCPLGHTYTAAVSSRTGRGCGCPYCAGRRVLPGFNDLATRYPELAAQWHPDLNEKLTPEQVTAGSHKKVWWQCPLGHVWKAVVYSRTGTVKTGCPICAGKHPRMGQGFPQRTGCFTDKGNATK